MGCVVSNYVVITPETMAKLFAAQLCFDNSPQLTIKTADAGCAVEITKLAAKLAEQGSENHTLYGTHDGWCFLNILFDPRKAWKL